MQLWNHKFTFIETKVKSLCLPNSSCLLSFNVFRKKMKIWKKTKAKTIKNTVSHSTFQDFSKKGLRLWVEHNEKIMISENDKTLKIVTIWLVFVCKLMIKCGIFYFQHLQRWGMEQDSDNCLSITEFQVKTAQSHHCFLPVRSLA